MKKVIKALAALALSLGLTAFVGCSVDTSEMLGSLGCKHTGGEATCTDAAVCTICNESYGEIDPENHDYDEVVTAATCTTDGYTTFTCKRCDETHTGDVVTAPGHTYTHTVTAPTCTAGGYTTHACSVCSHSYKDTATAALGHDYEAVVTAPTCTEDGYTTHTCATCGDTYQDSATDATGHSYATGVVTAPTCTDKGYTTHTCVKGDDSYVDSYVDALGHKDANIDAKCDVCDKYFAPEVGEAFKLRMIPQNGKTYYFTGSMQNTHYFGTNTDINKSVDLFLEAAEGGYYMYFMKGETKNYVYVVKSGSYTNLKYGETKGVWTWNDELGIFTTKVDSDDFYIGTYNTYTTMSPSGTFRITGNNASALGVSQFVARAATLRNHVHENTTVVTDPTCTKDGYSTTTCATCKTVVKTAGEPKTGHTLEAGAVTAPTCTAKGYTTYGCANCNYTEKKDEVAELGHSYDAVVTAPTCTAKGYTTHTCGTCGDTYQDSETEMIDHTYVEGECACGAQDPNYVAHVHQYEAVVTAPKCDAQGYTTYTCACEDTYVDDYVDALGHSYNAVVTEATCTTAGITTHTCAACGDSYTTDPVDATGHADANSDNACDNCGAALIKTETLSFASTATRVSQDNNKQVWKNGAITLTNNKGSSTSNVANYSNPARFYQSSQIIIDCAKMTKIVFNCNATKYTTALQNSIGSPANATVSVSGNVITVTFKTPTDTFNIATLTAQVRLNSMSVTYSI